MLVQFPRQLRQLGDVLDEFGLIGGTFLDGILERGEVSDELAGKYVELYDFPDGRLEVRWKGQSLPYRVFSKDQRVSHTAIVENKRLGHVLAIVKAQQDMKNIN